MKTAKEIISECIQEEFEELFTDEKINQLSEKIVERLNLLDAVYWDATSKQSEAEFEKDLQEVVGKFIVCQNLNKMLEL